MQAVLVLSLWGMSSPQRLPQSHVSPFAGHLASLLLSLTKTLVPKECQALSVFYSLISGKPHPKSCPENWAAQVKKSQALLALGSSLLGIFAVGEQSPIPKAINIPRYLSTSPKYHFEFLIYHHRNETPIPQGAKVLRYKDFCGI